MAQNEDIAEAERLVDRPEESRIEQDSIERKIAFHNWHIAVLFGSILFFFYDASVCCYAVYSFYETDQHWLLSAIAISLLALAAASMSCLSGWWYFSGEQRRKCFPSATRAVWLFRLACHACLLAPLARLVDALRCSLKCKSALERKDVEQFRTYDALLVLEDRDAVVLRLFQAYVCLTIQPVLRLVAAFYSGETDYVWHAAVASGSLASLAWSMVAFKVARDLDAGRRTDYPRKLIYGLGHFFGAGARCIALAVGAFVLPRSFLIGLALHLVAMFIYARWYHRKALTGNPFAWEKDSIKDNAFYVFLSVVHTFAFLNLNHYRSRARHLYYFTLCFLENATLMTYWWFGVWEPRLDHYLLYWGQMGAFLLGSSLLWYSHRVLSKVHHPNGLSSEEAPLKEEVCQEVVVEAIGEGETAGQTDGKEETLSVINEEPLAEKVVEIWFDRKPEESASGKPGQEALPCVTETRPASDGPAEQFEDVEKLLKELDVYALPRVSEKQVGRAEQAEKSESRPVSEPVSLVSRPLEETEESNVDDKEHVVRASHIELVQQIQDSLESVAPTESCTITLADSRLTESESESKEHETTKEEVVELVFEQKTLQNVQLRKEDALGNEEQMEATEESDSTKDDSLESSVAPTESCMISSEDSRLIESESESKETTEEPYDVIKEAEEIVEEVFEQQTMQNVQQSKEEMPLLLVDSSISEPIEEVNVEVELEKLEIPAEEAIEELELKSIEKADKEASECVESDGATRAETLERQESSAEETGTSAVQVETTEEPQRDENAIEKREESPVEVEESALANQSFAELEKPVESAPSEATREETPVSDENGSCAQAEQSDEARNAEEPQQIESLECQLKENNLERLVSDEHECLPGEKEQPAETGPVEEDAVVVIQEEWAVEVHHELNEIKEQAAKEESNASPLQSEILPEEAPKQETMQVEEGKDKAKETDDSVQDQIVTVENAIASQIELVPQRELAAMRETEVVSTTDEAVSSKIPSETKIETSDVILCETEESAVVSSEPVLLVESSSDQLDLVQFDSTAVTADIDKDEQETVQEIETGDTADLTADIVSLESQEKNSKPILTESEEPAVVSYEHVAPVENSSDPLDTVQLDNPTVTDSVVQDQEETMERVEDGATLTIDAVSSENASEPQEKDLEAIAIERKEQAVASPEPEVGSSSGQIDTPPITKDLSSGPQQSVLAETSDSDEKQEDGAPVTQITTEETHETEVQTVPASDALLSNEQLVIVETLNEDKADDAHIAQEDAEILQVPEMKISADYDALSPVAEENPVLAVEAIHAEAANDQLSPPIEETASQQVAVEAQVANAKETLEGTASMQEEQATEPFEAKESPIVESEAKQDNQEPLKLEVDSIIVAQDGKVYAADETVKVIDDSVVDTVEQCAQEEMSETKFADPLDGESLSNGLSLNEQMPNDATVEQRGPTDEPVQFKEAILQETGETSCQSQENGAQTTEAAVGSPSISTMPEATQETTIETNSSSIEGSASEEDEISQSQQELPSLPTELTQQAPKSPAGSEEKRARFKSKIPRKKH